VNRLGRKTDLSVKSAVKFSVAAKSGWDVRGLAQRSATLQANTLGGLCSGFFQNFFGTSTGRSRRKR
jgi:hypothetical protein